MATHLTEDDIRRIVREEIERDKEREAKAAYERSAVTSEAVYLAISKVSAAAGIGFPPKSR